MRTVFVTVLIIAAFVSVSPIAAQEEQTPQVELYGGYNYVRFNVTANVGGFPPTATFNANAEAVNSNTTPTAGWAS